jgi:hypothetical protein
MIRRWLDQGLRLTKIRKLLARQGVVLPYPTLYRFAVVELGFGRTAPTMRDSHISTADPRHGVIEERQEPLDSGIEFGRAQRAVRQGNSGGKGFENPGSIPSANRQLASRSSLRNPIANRQSSIVNLNRQSTISIVNPQSINRHSAVVNRQ